MRKPAPENPLLPHTRIRALYRGLVETRSLGDASAAATRRPRWLEACWVATVMTLEDGDLIFDLCTDALQAYLRSSSKRLAGAPSEQALQIFFAGEQSCFAGSGSQRILCAVGAAMALKSASALRVVVAYVRGDEVSAAEWRELARIASPGNLPLIIVVAGSSGVPALGSVIPVIPVESSDTLAIYRVAQEALVRARAEGGLVILECVPSLADPIQQLAAQMLARAVCTPAWLALVARQTTRAISKAGHGVHLTRGTGRPNDRSDRTTQESLQ